MIELMEIGPVPAEENCAQVGDIDFRNRAKREMSIYIKQLNRMFPEAYDSGVDFKAKFFNHDFGSYGEVCIVFDGNDDDAVQFAYHVEANLPGFWDDEALKELNDSF